MRLSPLRKGARAYNFLFSYFPERQTLLDNAMQIEHLSIARYRPQSDYHGVMKLIETEGEEWASYSSEAGRQKYENALKNSLTYVAHYQGNICGYLRSVNDFGLDLFVYDLLVGEEYRGNEVGKLLLEKLSTDHPGLNAYVLSDADGYYTKLGYKREGSIFKLMR